MSLNPLKPEVYPNNFRNSLPLRKQTAYALHGNWFWVNYVIISIITIIIILVQGIYNYIPETNHVSRVYSVAAILYSQFVLHVTLFRLW